MGEIFGLCKVCVSQGGIYVAVTCFIADKLLEYWLGKTDKVKSGSVLELVLNILRTIINKKSKGD